MAQRMESFKDHCRAALTRPFERRTKANRIRHTNEVPHIDARSHIMRENEFFRSYIYSPSITWTKRSKQPFQCKMQAWITKHNGNSEWNLSKITSAQR